MVPEKCVLPLTGSPSSEVMSGASEAVALHLARIQELTAPTPEAAAALLADIEATRAALRIDPDLSANAQADIDRIAEGTRWISMGKPGEPVPDTYTTYTYDMGYPVLEWRRGLAFEVVDAFQAGTDASRKALREGIEDHHDEIVSELSQVVELSEGYRLCESFLTDAPAGAARPPEYRYAEVTHKVVGRYGLALHELRSNPNASREYARGINRVDLTESYKPKSVSGSDAAIGRAQEYFYPRLAEALRQQDPSGSLPDLLADPNNYQSLSLLALDVACQINGNEACPASNYFLQHAILAAFRDAQPRMAGILYAQKIDAAEHMFERFQKLSHDWSWNGGSWPRWWLRGLPYPPRLDPMQLQTASNTEAAPAPGTQELSPPISRERLDELERTIIGEILIDQRPSSAAVARRLILTTPRTAELPPVVADGNPQLRIRFTKDTAQRYMYELPYIPGYVVSAEALDLDGSRTFDFVRDQSQEDPYAFCAQPLTDDQRRAVTDFFEGLGATRMAKNLRASRKVRIGDIEDLLGRSSQFYAPHEGETAPPWSVEQGYLRLQCVAAACIERDSLEASGVPEGALRILSGLVLPDKGQPLTAVEHASVEYTDPAGRRFILDPPVIDRELPAAPAAQPDVQPDTQAEMTLSDDAPRPAEVQPTQSAPEQAAPDAFETARYAFERLLARSFGLGTPNRPATAQQVWQHIQVNCRRPGDIVAMTATLVDRTREATVETLSPVDVKQHLADIQEAAEFIRAVAADPTLRRRAGGYAPEMGQALLHTLNSLQSAYEYVLPRVE
ncbi:MAG TPA: hypothetical protein VLH86_03230 [Patescibacteria group bacterium]|nr:hypothetical protein [Patescibacteria group bacterium]